MGRTTKLKIDKKGRQCTVCLKFKLWDQYFTDKNNKYGHVPRCRDCYAKVRPEQKSVYKPSTPPLDALEFDPSKPIDLSFLVDLGGFSENEIKKLLHYVNVYTAEPHFMPRGKIYKEFFPHRPAVKCGQLVLEFTEVYKSGQTFEAYMKTDRKFRRDGLKVIKK